MSVVTTLLLLPDAREPEGTVRALNERLVKLRPSEGDRFRNLSEVRPHPEPSPSDFWGGTKVPEADAWGAALNHVDSADVVSAARAVEWHFPALLVYQGQDDFRWSFVTLGLSGPEHEFPEWSG